MHHLALVAVLLFCALPTGLVSTDVTFKELVELDATCNDLDTCKANRSLESLDRYTCHCGSICSKLRTCCVDSPYRDIKTPGRRPSCRSANDESGRYYFMVDKCSSSPNTDPGMAKLCTENPIEQDNLTPMIPVTSLSTNVTYKNYYCLKCNEATNNFIYWNMKILSNTSAEEVKAEDVKLTYDTVSKTWKASIRNRVDGIPVSLLTEVPHSIRNLLEVCIPNVISTCSGEWRDRDVRRKCGKYTSIVFIPQEDGSQIIYRNPHCSLCNFENFGRMGCGNPISGRAKPTKTPFSFSLLLDFNTADGEQVGKRQLCDDNSRWDPHFKKCRRFVCLPGNVVKDGKCVPA